MELLNLIRVGLVLASAFLLLPLYATRRGDKWKSDWKELAAPVFLRTALFFQFTVVLLNQWKLCLPGIMAAIYFLWLLANAALSYRARWIYDTQEWKLLWGRILRKLEGKGRKSVATRSAISPQAVLTYVLITFLVGRAAWFPLNNLRFFTQDSYSRALSLETLLAGGSWTYDGSLTLLMPAAFWSGLDAASVIRLSSPIILLALFLTIWNVNRTFGGSWRSTFFTITTYWVSTSWLQLSPGAENSSRDLASVFLLLAIASLRTSYGYASCAMLMALLISPQLDGSLLCLLLAMLIGLIADRILRNIPAGVAQPATAILLFAAGLSAIVAVEPRAEAVPLQYEASARSVYEIATTYPRNQWSIVSPSSELAQIYGRGWHIQLTDFVRDHSPVQSANPQFEFRYPTPHIFVFIEKKPLPNTAHALASNGVNTAYSYATKSGRIALEFEAAQIMAAYIKTHANVNVFHEDEELVVYHIEPKRRQ